MHLLTCPLEVEFKSFFYFMNLQKNAVLTPNHITTFLENIEKGGPCILFEQKCQILIILHFNHSMITKQAAHRNGK